MHEETDSEFARYFSYLNLFAAFMLVLVLGSNFLVMFVGWEGVGLCSYLLIGFWFQKKSAADAGKKAFIVNRIGDFGFILGMLLMFVALRHRSTSRRSRDRRRRSAPETTFGTVSLDRRCCCSSARPASRAQIPLYVWLPDAMEGPTPVSALIHAATMVTAGVYMIGRNAVLFSHAPQTLTIVAIIGAATALMAGTIGLVQNDIKRVLAYSTVSQLGYMFLAMGVGVKQRQHVLQAADLLLVDEDVGVFEDGFHRFGVGHEVRREIALVELHAFDDVEGGFDRLGFFDRDGAVLADLVHRVGDDLADRACPSWRKRSRPARFPCGP